MEEDLFATLGLSSATDDDDSNVAADADPKAGVDPKAEAPKEASPATDKNAEGTLHHESVPGDAIDGHHFLVTEAPPPIRPHEVGSQGK